MKPKWGIIGCGGISRFHFAGLEKVGADVHYIADLDKRCRCAVCPEIWCEIHHGLSGPHG